MSTTNVVNDHMKKSDVQSRTDRVARAAVEVLGEKGAAGLTHRAVDRQAALPEGSTSNHFRTRAALLDAICRYLTDHDLAKLKERAEKFSGQGDLTVGAAARALVAIVDDWTNKESVLTAARLELFLIAYRDPSLAARLSEVRHAFRDQTVEWLDGLSKGAAEHVAIVMATIEGLTSNQLLHSGYRLSKNEMEEEMELVLGALLG